MTKLLAQVWAFLVEDFDPVVYGGTGLALLAFAVANYGLDLVQPHVRSGAPLLLPTLVVLYGLPWLGVLALKQWRGPVPALGAGGWRMAAAALVVVVVAIWFPFHEAVAHTLPRPLFVWARVVLWNLKSTVCWLAPVALYWWAVDGRPAPRLYGFVLRGFDARPYLQVLLLLAPLIVWASFQPAFQEAYPTYRPGRAETMLSAAVTVPIYELVYGFDFTFVELYFRGFLVIGLGRTLGRHAVLPMVAMYAVLHLGKPLPEYVGSIVGGYALGVFALRQRSIAGGVLLHLGVAWGMELAAWAQRGFGGG